MSGMMAGEMEGVKTGMSSPSKPRYAADRDSTHAETIQIAMVTGVSSGALILLLICYRLIINSAEAVEKIDGHEFFNLSFLGAVSPGFRVFFSRVTGRHKLDYTILISKHKGKDLDDRAYRHHPGGGAGVQFKHELREANCDYPPKYGPAVVHASGGLLLFRPIGFRPKRTRKRNSPRM